MQATKKKEKKKQTPKAKSNLTQTSLVLDKQNSVCNYWSRNPALSVVYWDTGWYRLCW